ncbi:two pore channel protein 1-like [Oscarella lobularis]|uniref:two pore channel protein 1-like n=1 Tax=Oscarella lobularis TaxID=121494 RepID=UPI00331371F6
MEEAASFLKPDADCERRNDDDDDKIDIYESASIFLEEGLANDKYDVHPKTRKEVRAYRLCHNHAFWIIEVVAPLGLVLLALFEQPTTVNGLPVWGKVIIELVFACTIFTLLGVRARWLGLKRLLQQKRIIVNAVILFALLLDGLVELIQGKHHPRYLRCLRPVLFFDAYYASGLRRIVRDIVYSLRPIVDMLILVFFFLTISSLFAFFLFSEIGDDLYFQTFRGSFVQMFVLLTTSNHPDIMMVEYDYHPYSALFFNVFLLVGLYLLLNLFLAVVYGTFGDQEKDKFRKLYLHKRAGLMLAFNMIVKDKTVMNFEQFKSLMKFARPRMNNVEVLCIFKAIDEDDSGGIQINEFCGFFSYTTMRWTPLKKGRQGGRWYDSKRCPRQLAKLGKLVRRIVEHDYFQYLVGFIILCNLVALIFEAVSTTDPVSQSHMFGVVDEIFLVLYCIELALKVFGQGPKLFFHDFWNWFDLAIVVVSIVGEVGEAVSDDGKGNGLSSFVYLRPLRLIRLFALRKRYRDILFALWVVMPRMGYMLLLLFSIYYFFAIIGMEVFHGVLYKGVFNNDTKTIPETFAYLIDYYDGVGPGRYYNINFDNILRSFETLFILTVVNNWYVIMDAYTYLCGEAARAFFIIFYLISLVIVTIVVSFVLDSFAAMDAEQKENARLSQDNNSELKERRVTLTAQDLNHAPSYRDPSENVFLYIGMRKRNKDDLNLQLYKDDIPGWCAEYDAALKDGGASMNVVAALKAVKRRSRLSAAYAPPPSNDGGENSASVTVPLKDM